MGTLILFMLGYIVILLILLATLRFWEIAFLKDTILWIVFVGFLLLMNSNKINSENNYLVSILKDSVKGIVIVEFIANFYSFSIGIELLIIPVLTFIAVIPIVTKGKPEYKSVEKFSNGSLSIFGGVILIYTIYKISQGFNEFANLLTLKSFLLPILLTILYLPFLYFVALWTLYEVMYIRLSSQLKKKKHKKYLKRLMILTFHINRKKLRLFQSELGFEPVQNKKDINRVFENFQQSQIMSKS
ncbi:MAG: hypothetical protein R3279_05890 [Putridiphycobacter sp.]|nr:hypothetical protein [Putridiphycobacter sp.]